MWLKQVMNRRLSTAMSRLASTASWSSSWRTTGLANRRPTHGLINYQQKRWLNLQEYQSKHLMHQNGVRVQRFCVVESADHAKFVVGQPVEDQQQYKECPSADDLDSSSRATGTDEKLADAREYVIKAQVLAGGRGKGQFKKSSMRGGVQLTKDKMKVVDICSKMLDDYLVTAQTTADGILVKKVMIAEALDIAKELYLAILMDRASGGPMIVASPMGGVDIESVAEKTPEAIHKFAVSITDNPESLDPAIAKRVASEGLALTGSVMDQAAEQISSLYSMFLKLDALQIEVNPLGVTPDDVVVCFDAKMNFDENAAFRQKWMAQFEAENAAEGDPREQFAKSFNLNFVPMDGKIGCLVNGAGLAMATMDIIHHYGGSPANFLDVGGSVNQQGVEKAFKLITQDKAVGAILVNIFGGIVNCETVARGLIAARDLVSVPLVVRLEGTNAEVARVLLERVPDIVTATDLDDAARKAVRSVSI